MRGQFHSMSNFNPRIICGVSPPRDEVPSALAQDKLFGFGQKTQNHFCPCAAPRRRGGRLFGCLRLCHESRWLRNSLRSDSARQSGRFGAASPLHPTRFKRGQNTVALDGNPITSASPTDLGIPYFFLQILI